MTIPEIGVPEMLAKRSVWAFPAVVGSVLVALMTLIYFGSIVDPAAHLHGLPVLVVDEDSGAVGAQVAGALRTTPAITQRLSVREATLSEAEASMNRDSTYATIIVPAGFTDSVEALVGATGASSPSISRPTIEVLSNVRAGSLGVSLADAVLDPALAAISSTIGNHLVAVAPADTPPAARAVLTDPIEVTAQTWRPLPSHAGLGLSAFYASLLIMMCGFLGATIINTSVDGVLGFANSEVGPWWRQRLPTSITRWRTLLIKWAVAVPATGLFTAILLAVSVGVLGMDAPHLIELWLFAWFSAAVIAIGTLVLFAALGALGQLVALLLFVYLALASSGGTVPLQALGGFYRFVANFEPLRQILDAVRAILYFNGSGAAGLERGLILTSIGLVLWLVVGAAITNIYDKRGYHRIDPDMLEYVHRSAAAYQTVAPEDRGPPSTPSV